MTKDGAARLDEPAEYEAVDEAADEAENEAEDEAENEAELRESMAALKLNMLTIRAEEQAKVGRLFFWTKIF